MIGNHKIHKITINALQVKRLIERGHKVCFMAEYYLPDINKIDDMECLYENRILGPEDFKELYLPGTQ